MDYSKLHWYSDNEFGSVYSLLDFPNILIHINEEDEIVKVELLDI